MTTSLRLLFLEDSPADVELALHELRRAGYEPSAVRVETEREYRDHLHPATEIILADFSMPEFDSLRALEIMQESGLDIPFIIVSGTIGEERAVHVMQCGASDYIIKDRLARLGQAVIHALEQKRLQKAKRIAEESLRESEELVRNAFDYNNVAMVVTGLNFRFLRANDAFLKMFGYSRPEMLSLSLTDITHPEDLAKSYDRVRSLTAGTINHIQIEKRYLHKDGHTLWGLANMSLLHDAAGKPMHFVGQVQDITERVVAERALRESQKKSAALEEQFRQSQKMEAIGQLAAGVAHDFNNLLTIILGYSELSLAKLPPNDPERESLNQIRNAGEHAAKLTHQLLAFAHKQILAPVVIDLNSLVTETKKMLVRLIGADIELITVLDPRLEPVEVDPIQIEQMLLNLVVNARDAMPTGGRLTIKTCNTVLSDSQLAQQAEPRPGPYVMLAVCDTGDGMDEVTKTRIFEPFFTTKQVGKGTGLGLSTVFGIVKQSCGLIDVESSLGSGSTFRIYLPGCR